MHRTLYRKWRPETFDDVCGQDHVTTILKYQVAQNKTSHAYLFCGSRGTGKTTCAKILARALNCESPINGNPCGKCPVCAGILSGAITDVIEMDAASNNGVDHIRDIREDVAYAPSECKKRVFIIDEVHMLSVSAFNALLKTLEEPPAHIVFILATTELHKIPATILSRCQRFDFRRIDKDCIVDRLRFIAQNEQIPVEDDALHLIAKLASGGMRDAIGMLELCAAASGEAQQSIDERTAAALLGTSPLEETAAIVRAVIERDLPTLFLSVDHIYKEARDISVFWQSLISFYRDMLVIRSLPDPSSLIELPEKQRMIPAQLARQLSNETLLYHIRILDETLQTLQKNNVPTRVTAEMALIRMCRPEVDTSTAAILSRLADLEDRVALGGFAAASQVNTPDPSASEAAPVHTEAATLTAVTDDTPKAETSAKQKKHETAAPSPSAQVDITAEPSEKKTLRSFRAWQDAVSKIERHDAILSSFLHQFRAYTCDSDKKFHLYAPNLFYINLIRVDPQRMKMITDAINIVCGETRYTEADLVFSCTEKADTDGYEKIDDLIDHAADPDKEAVN
ncbi:MAG: DNA polymerase III subunit gamma/tau [Clostridia bacterium]|nr:DNA polymerase III subunit gamma/tau [Clostridia bacterium]